MNKALSITIGSLGLLFIIWMGLVIKVLELLVIGVCYGE